jgi:FAD/FMN-containing dehydrogenase
VREWGPGCWHIDAADVVSARGDEVSLTPASDPDLFWALCGGSAGFPGIVTRFHLRLAPLPVIRSRRVTLPLDSLPELVAGVAGILASASPGLEISLIARKAHWLADHAPAVTVAATAFRQTESEADDVLAGAWGDLDGIGRVVADSGIATTFLNELEGEGGWEQGLRYFADDAWIQGNYDPVGRLVAEAASAAPSPLSRIVIAFGNTPEHRDVAFTAFGDFSTAFYATWSDERCDRANIDWVRHHILRAEPYTAGHYIGETDLSVSDARVLGAYPADKWERLVRIIRAHDPDGRFHGFLGHELGA